MAVLGDTKILGVVGSPIGHSLSPVMHNAAIAALNLNYIYVPLSVDIHHLAIAVAGFKTIQSLEGFNLTIPHKQEIMPLLDEISDIAKAVGAVNTVKRSGEAWVGTNTDVAGFLVPLQKLDLDWQNVPVVILGNGGAAKAVVAACLSLSCPDIHIIGRDRDKMQIFYNQVLAQLPPEQHRKLNVHPWSALEDLLNIAKLVVNTTPIGMAGSVMARSASPLTAAQIELMPPEAIAYDLIYNPRPTEFLKMAAARGLTTIDGLTMLIHQGAIALEFWTGCTAPIAVMEQSLLQHFS